MGLQFWFQTDVAQKLASISAAGSERGPEYHLALAHVALAFGIGPAPTAEPERAATIDGQARELAAKVGS